MQPATNDVIEVSLSVLLMLLGKLLWLCTKYSQLFHGICAILFRVYMIHNLLLCQAHFALLANVTIILNCRQLLQEYHITGRYTQSQYVAVHKRKQKHKKKSQLCAYGLFYAKFNAQQLLSEAFFHGMRIFGGVES